jgi:hypothetical protein
VRSWRHLSDTKGRRRMSGFWDKARTRHSILGHCLQLFVPFDRELLEEIVELEVGRLSAFEDIVTTFERRIQSRSSSDWSAMATPGRIPAWTNKGVEWTNDSSPARWQLAISKTEFNGYRRLANPHQNRAGSPSGTSLCKLRRPSSP